LGVTIEIKNQRLSFFEELKRRSVFKVGIAYIVMAWVALSLQSKRRCKPVKKQCNCSQIIPAVTWLVVMRI